MSTIVPIDSDKIVEILFENSENIPNDIYLHIMNLMKRYHEFQDNEDEIRLYLSTVDKKVKNNFEQYITKKYKIKKYCKIDCRCLDNLNLKDNLTDIVVSIRIFGIVFIVLCMFGAIVYGIASKKVGFSKDSQFNRTNTTILN